MIGIRLGCNQEKKTKKNRLKQSAAALLEWLSVFHLLGHIVKKSILKGSTAWYFYTSFIISSMMQPVRITYSEYNSIVCL